MGFFKSLGKRAERTKRRFTGSSRYECLSCEATFDEESQTCPDCGSEEIVTVE